MPTTDSLRPFSLLVKPASGDCNLSCDYCFYTRKCALFPEAARHRMTEAVLTKMVAGYLATRQPVYSFGWQGGEPTLMGLPFFEQVVALQQQYGKTGTSVANGLQTNATRIDAEFARFLARYNFLSGCSLDGPQAMHDRYRRTRGGRGSHADVLRGIRHLRDQHAEFNILVLVSQANVRHAREVYRYLADQGFLFHQYIPCVEFDADGQPQPYTVSGAEWGDFQCELFDAWYAHDTRRVSIRHFDAVLASRVDDQATVCTMADNCCQYFVVEHNGNVYPCDFFVEPELKLGNILTDAWADLQASPVYRDFGCGKRRWHRACATCRHLRLCHGDCLKHRVVNGGVDSLSHLCAGWKQFYDHSMDRFDALAETVRRERRAAATLPAARPAGVSEPSAPPGRNDPCPCGSGRKFKRCCGA